MTGIRKNGLTVERFFVWLGTKTCRTERFSKEKG